MTLGCGDRSGRVGVNGQVTFASGDRIDRGSIEFAPLDGSTTVSGARLSRALRYPSSARFADRLLSRADLCPTLVEARPGAPGVLGLMPPEERVAARYNVESELMAEILNHEDQKIDFQVE